MNVEEYRTFCLKLTGVEESFPFGDDVLVLKVMGKMFTLVSLSSPWFRINLKCEPQRAISLREEYQAIIPGWHMNKKHWNTITFEHNLISDEMVLELTKHSYNLVVSKLTKKMKKELFLLKESSL